MSAEHVESVNYALGHSDDELDRLATQARIVGPLTRRFWEAAGLTPGMRVLDVGCGSGETTRLLADMVGTSGHVVGIDNAVAAIGAARSRSTETPNVTYVVAEPSANDLDGPFDAVVGRYVLMFQPDPTQFLASAARHARPGGIVAFHELDANGWRSRPAVPTFDRVARWNTEATRRYGADPNCGSRLYATFVTAGLNEPVVLVDGVHGRGAAGADVLLRARNLCRSLMPQIERFGIAGREEVGIDTLYDRMLNETIASDSIVVSPLEFGASTRA